jgi:hypothetical protein
MNPFFDDKIIVGMGYEDNDNNKWRFELNDWPWFKFGQLVELGTEPPRTVRSGQVRVTRVQALDSIFPFGDSIPSTK